MGEDDLLKAKTHWGQFRYRTVSIQNIDGLSKNINWSWCVKLLTQNYFWRQNILHTLKFWSKCWHQNVFRSLKITVVLLIKSTLTLWKAYTWDIKVKIIYCNILGYFCNENVISCYGVLMNPVIECVVVVLTVLSVTDILNFVR